GTARLLVDFINGIDPTPTFASIAF
ncbi:MAG: hypothetical protein QOI46_348, partial [Alphaproteobacteria bacterium]|nr:hypothetical protein [Alphaproteobacteria bacterium]